MSIDVIWYFPTYVMCFSIYLKNAFILCLIKSNGYRNMWSETTFYVTFIFVPSVNKTFCYVQSTFQITNDGDTR